MSNDVIGLKVKPADTFKFAEYGGPSDADEIGEITDTYIEEDLAEVHGNAGGFVIVMWPSGKTTDHTFEGHKGYTSIAAHVPDFEVVRAE